MGNTGETFEVRSFCYEAKESGHLKGRGRDYLVSNAPLQAGESLSALSDAAIISMALLQASARGGKTQSLRLEFDWNRLEVPRQTEADGARGFDSQGYSLKKNWACEIAFPGVAVHVQHVEYINVD